MLTLSMTHLDIIDLWPSGAVLASDVGSTVEAVKKWRQRERIPPKVFARIVKAARKRRFGVSLTDLYREAA